MTHEVWINVEGLAHPIKPSGVVIIDRDTGLPVPTPAQGLTRAQLDAAPVRTADTVLDSTGQPFCLDACGHTYGYSAGLLVTDTATDGAASWVKTYTYTAAAGRPRRNPEQPRLPRGPRRQDFWPHLSARH